MNIKKVIKSIENSKLEWRKHSLQRMLQRGITRQEVLETVKYGEIIESYEDDKPFESVLVFNKLRLKYLHVVYAFDDIEEMVYIITAYEPSKEVFGDDLKTRLRKDDE